VRAHLIIPTATGFTNLDWQDAMAVQSIALLPENHGTYTEYGTVSSCSAEHKCSHAFTEAAQAAHLLLSSAGRCSSTVAILYGSLSDGYLVEKAQAILHHVLDSHCGRIVGHNSAEQQASWLASVEAWQLQHQGTRHDGSFFSPQRMMQRQKQKLVVQGTSSPSRCTVR
jgi:hypothetical protein